MNFVIGMAVLFLAAPFLGYVVISLPISPLTKLVITIVGVLFLVTVPLIVLAFSGGGG